MDWDRYISAWAQQRGGQDQRRVPAPVRGARLLGQRLTRALADRQVRPAALAAAGLVFAAAVPLVAGRGAVGLLAAAALVLLSGLASALCQWLGALSDRASPVRAIGESVADRLAEVGWLAGFWVLGVPGALVLACAVLTCLHEYVRVQALAAGMTLAVTRTMAERSMRLWVAAGGLALAGLVGLTGLTGLELGPGVLVVAAMSWLLITVHGLSQLAGALRRALV